LKEVVVSTAAADSVDSGTSAVVGQGEAVSLSRAPADPEVMVARIALLEARRGPQPLIEMVAVEVVKLHALVSMLHGMLQGM
jgi:hypothetical protein